MSHLTPIKQLSQQLSSADAADANALERFEKVNKQASNALVVFGIRGLLSNFNNDDATPDTSTGAAALQKEAYCINELCGQIDEVEATVKKTQQLRDDIALRLEEATRVEKANATIMSIRKKWCEREEQSIIEEQQRKKDRDRLEQNKRAGKAQALARQMTRIQSN